MHHINVKPPGWFQRGGMEAFKALKTLPDDVIMVSYPKCGTTWFEQILFCLLRMDDKGHFPDDPAEMIGGRHQVYPDGVPVEPPDRPLYFGWWSFQDLVSQPRPRLFPAHIRAGNLPPSIAKQGRVVMIARNPKDALVSYFFFLNKWARPGLAPPEVVAEAMRAFYFCYNRRAANAGTGYGDYYSWHRDMITLQEQVGDRGFFTLYERLHEDFAGEIRRLARFLGVRLTRAKFVALARYVDFDSMAGRQIITMRKGVVGDYQAYLSPTHWAWMDRLFLESVGDIKAMRPLLRYMGIDAEGDGAQLGDEIRSASARLRAVAGELHDEGEGWCKKGKALAGKRRYMEDFQPPELADVLVGWAGDWALRHRPWDLAGRVAGDTLLWPDQTESTLCVFDGAVTVEHEGVRYSASAMRGAIHWSDGHVWVPWRPMRRR